MCLYTGSCIILSPKRLGNTTLCVCVCFCVSVNVSQSHFLLLVLFTLFFESKKHRGGEKMFKSLLQRLWRNWLCVFQRQLQIPTSIPAPLDSLLSYFKKLYSNTAFYPLFWNLCVLRGPTNFVDLAPQRYRKCRQKWCFSLRKCKFFDLKNANSSFRKMQVFYSEKCKFIDLTFFSIGRIWKITTCFVSIFYKLSGLIVDCESFLVMT